MKVRLANSLFGDLRRAEHLSVSEARDGQALALTVGALRQPRCARGSICGVVERRQDSSYVLLNDSWTLHRPPAIFPMSVICLHRKRRRVADSRTLTTVVLSRIPCLTQYRGNHRCIISPYHRYILSAYLEHCRYPLPSLHTTAHLVTVFSRRKLRRLFVGRLSSWSFNGTSLHFATTVM